MNHRILVIDDDPKILEICQMILAPEVSKAGEELESMAGELFEEDVEDDPDETLNVKFEVTTANEGKIGVDEVGKAIQAGQPFTMAFVDIRMPYGIDGLETARQILSIDPDMEIIILTGYSDTPRQSMARQLGVSNFQLLKKPFDPDELMQMAQFLAHRHNMHCLLYTSPSPRDKRQSRMPSSA